MTREDHEDNQDLADAIWADVQAMSTPSTIDQRIEVIIESAERHSAEYLMAIGERVMPYLCSYLTPKEIEALDEHYLPGTIDDSISYAKDSP